MTAKEKRIKSALKNIGAVVETLETATAGELIKMKALIHRVLNSSLETLYNEL